MAQAKEAFKSRGARIEAGVVALALRGVADISAILHRHATGDWTLVVPTKEGARHRVRRSSVERRSRPLRGYIVASRLVVEGQPVIVLTTVGIGKTYVMLDSEVETGGGVVDEAALPGSLSLTIVLLSPGVAELAIRGQLDITAMLREYVVSFPGGAGPISGKILHADAMYYDAVSKEKEEAERGGRSFGPSLYDAVRIYPILQDTVVFTTKCLRVGASEVRIGTTLLSLQSEQD